MERWSDVEKYSNSVISLIHAFGNVHGRMTKFMTIALRPSDALLEVMEKTVVFCELPQSHENNFLSDLMKRRKKPV